MLTLAIGSYVGICASIPRSIGASLTPLSVTSMVRIASVGINAQAFLAPLSPLLGSVHWLAHTTARQCPVRSLATHGL